MLGIVLLSLSGIVGCGSGSRSESPPRAPTRSLEDLVAEARARFDTVQLTNDSGREACGVILTFQGAQLPYPEFQPFEIGRQVIVEAPKFRNCQRLGGNELLLFSGAWPAGATASVTFNRSESGAVQIASRRWIAKDETVYFPDPAIRRAVLEAVAGETASSIAGAPEGIPAPTQVLLLDALLLTELDASRRGVTDLRGIDACRSLSRLNLAGNLVKDVSPLAALENLRTLDLSGSPLDSISALAGLVMLTELNLSRTGVRDVASLAKLDNLRRLDLSGNPLDGIEVLGGLVNLVELDLSSTGIAGRPAALARLLSLQVLRLAGNRVDDITDLSTMMQLKILDLSNNRIVDIAALKEVLSWPPQAYPGLAPSWLYMSSQMQELRLNGNQITDVSALQGSRVRLLDLSDNRIESTESLRGMKCLYSVDLSGNRIVRLPDFTDCPELYSVNLARNLIPAVTLRRAMLANLGALCLRENNITSLQVTGGARDSSRLHSLDLAGNDLAVVGDLALLPELTMLLLGDNAIRDLSPLSGLRGLRYLDLSRNSIAELGPIRGR